MRDIFFISIGGFLGAISRFALTNRIQSVHRTGFPLGTLLVNLLGAFVLGLLIGMNIHGQLYSLLGIGFMGAFTTFSTLKLESEQLMKAGRKKQFYVYLFCSYGFGLIITSLGLVLGTEI
jgi:CrcB protein